jgi:hypothetical protein
MYAQAVAPPRGDGAGLWRTAVVRSGTGHHARNLVGSPSHAHRGEPRGEGRLLAPPRLRSSRLRLASGLQALVVMTSPKARRRHAGLGAALAFMVVGGTPACACGWWWWGCSDGYGYRQPTRVYGYAARRNPSLRVPSRAELRGAGPIPGGDVGLQAPIMSSSGLLQSAMPARGPTLFGPPAPGYYYNGTSVRGWQQRTRRSPRTY